MNNQAVYTTSLLDNIHKIFKVKKMYSPIKIVPKFLRSLQESIFNIVAMEARDLNLDQTCPEAFSSPIYSDKAASFANGNKPQKPHNLNDVYTTNTNFLSIESKLKSLDKDLYEPFVMHLEGYKSYEIAEYLHVSEKTIKKRIAAARIEMVQQGILLSN